MMATVDYSLYLVTDSTKQILGGRDLVTVVEAAVKGGVTVVQLRHKTAETSDLVNIARRLHVITTRYHVPLIINDRVDVAQAAGAEGVHLGQDDMDISTARQILGNNAIIGATVSTPEEAVQAARLGANYLGIGTVFTTATKDDSKSIIGTLGVRTILAHLYGAGFEDLATVCIGGVNSSNVQLTLHQSHALNKQLSGVAMVSAIIGAEDPQTASKHLRSLISATRTPIVINLGSDDPAVLIKEAPSLLRRVVQQKPLNHNMTNLVVQNFAANVALCAGSSPIMSNNAAESDDLAAIGGSLVVNMGTVTKDALDNYIVALRSYNAMGKPVVLDPVGCGATSVRKLAVRRLMNAAHFDVIKGNESEIRTVLGGDDNIKQHGVDSTDSSSTPSDKARVVKELATRERNVVLMTGKIDYISDGVRTFSISNGHEYLGSITGSGCALGTAIAALVAVEHADRLKAVLAGVLLYEIAAEFAAIRKDVQGPGSFVPAFLDEIHSIRNDTVLGRESWLDRAQIASI